METKSKSKKVEKTYCCKCKKRIYYCNLYDKNVNYANIRLRVQCKEIRNAKWHTEVDKQYCNNCASDIVYNLK